MMLHYWRRCALVLGLFAMPAFPQNLGPYLALGDSIPFGMNVLLLPPTPLAPNPTPDQFIGYPEVMRELSPHIRVMANASCPGETSASFLNANVERDNGCNTDHVNPNVTAFKKPGGIGLHVAYTGSQMRFAVAYLLENRNTKLVTLSIGANDLILLQADCLGDMNCVAAGLNGVLSTYASNLAQILTAIREEGRYKRKLVLVKYYSPDQQSAPIIAALNSVMEQVGSQFGAEFADGFAAFQEISQPFQGDPCRAGLLTRIPLTNTCDVHPSLYGQSVLAATTLSVASRD